MKKVLLAVDESEGSQSVLSVYRSVVPSPESVILIHVPWSQQKHVTADEKDESVIRAVTEVDGPAFSASPGRNADDVITGYLTEVEKSGTTHVKALVRNGTPAKEILRAAREENVDLIIMGRTGKRGLRRLLGGCVTREVEKYATVPVLIAQEGGGGKIISYRWRGAYVSQ